MLGKLARWLRMLGQDTTYSSKLKDEDLLRIAKEDKRTLLTRDFNLYQQAIKNKIQVFYIKSRNKSEILGELSKKFGIPLILDMKISRCPLCNSNALYEVFPPNFFLRISVICTLLALNSLGDTTGDSFFWWVLFVVTDILLLNICYN